MDGSQTVLKTIYPNESDTIVTIKSQTLPTYYLKVYSTTNTYSSSYSYGATISYVSYAEHMWDTPLDGLYLNCTAPIGYDTISFGNYHLGVDFSDAGILGANVYSMCSGTVISAGEEETMGNYVIVRSDDIDVYTGNHFTIRYMHFNEFPLVSTGQRVEAGTVIGKVGNTGYSTGAHLHIDVNTSGYTSGSNMRNNKESVVNLIDFFVLDLVYISGDLY